MSKVKPVSTPLANHFNLFLEQDSEVEGMSKIPYDNAVDCLMYGMVYTRPDLAQTVSQMHKFMYNPGKQH